MQGLVMDNCNNEKSTVLNVLFASREENICVITKEDKKRIKESIINAKKLEPTVIFNIRRGMIVEKG